uniref:Uncharacterized protein n=1 Tax=Percolomonas cosmopolitus TaxID=63605 RepID=A0A7S1KU99_9EUKA|mmetsp:Transcript_9335/g.34572  ORF Transcript_9335/g.34572 Transcript_9335/m.34572 type:complete len:316 (+) Transcript_9335:291-1238(+)|eukprot:CAMPEP_0117440914 /NCGR_PEP_ID=MMETSP0759-20121206/3346_1 /TAXON_ID=63605 /ORGANISM="Percolomonas cosmopolitus, Strain WS" /LENGTH=315 /DNA_ID=CAMNT_0005232715 /DNA_START=286 /DNA_END=1233 /DNA_ORIENTATION=+
MSLNQLTNQATRYHQITKYFLQYYNLLSTLGRSTFVGRSENDGSRFSKANATQVFISGVSEVKQVKLSHQDFESIKARFANGEKEINLDSVQQAHNDAYAASLRSKKDMWSQFLEFNLKPSLPEVQQKGDSSVPPVETVRPLPQDAAVIEYFTKHCEQFDNDNQETLVEYLGSNKEWKRQAITKSTPEQLQVFKMQDFANTYSGLDLEKRVSTQKLQSARERWGQWKSRKGILSRKILTQVNHVNFQSFQEFPVMYKPRQIQGVKTGIALKSKKKAFLKKKFMKLEKTQMQAERMEKRRVVAEANTPNVESVQQV